MKWGWFITMWLAMWLAVPFVTDRVREINDMSAAIATKEQRQALADLRTSLEAHKARESAMVSLLHYHKIIDEREFYEMKFKVMED